MESVPQSLRLAHLYLVTSEDASDKAKQRDKLRNELLPWLKSLDKDERGNHIYEFPQPLNTSESASYKGLMAQRRTTELVNEERARELIQKYNLQERCLKEVTEVYVDYDAMYAANQEGIIPDDEIDSIIEIEESYALVKVKA